MIELYYHLGAIWEKLGDISSARQYYQKSIQVRPESPHPPAYNAMRRLFPPPGSQPEAPGNGNFPGPGGFQPGAGNAPPSTSDPGRRDPASERGIL
jgi:hypothetical protein